MSAALCAQPASATRTRAVPSDDARSTWEAWLRTPPPVASPPRAGRVLLISYEFPPVGGSGVQRPAKLVKYLHRLGWTVEVLTAGHDRFLWRDDVLVHDIPPDCRVHRIRGFEPANLAHTATLPARGLESRSLLPRGTAARIEDALHWRLSSALAAFGTVDGREFWIGSAVRAALRLHRRKPFDAVISTGPPHCFHRVALRFARQARVPWVADLRDPFIHDFYRSPVPRDQSLAMLRLERTVLRHADRIVTTCPALPREFLARHPDLSPERFCTITNGFDRDDLLASLDAAPSGSPGKGQCVLTYVGACYGKTELAKLIEPMQRVLARHSAWRDDVRLRVAGTMDSEQSQRWRRECPEWLELFGYVDHAQAIRMLLESSCSLLLLPESRHGRRVIPGKAFELLALPVHLLALVPPGSETEKVVAAGGACTIAPMDDPGAVEAAIERVLGQHFTDRLQSHRHWPSLEAYDRLALCSAYAECLQAACNHRFVNARVNIS